MRFRVEPRDVPRAVAGRRLGLGPAQFDAALPNLLARGFPRPDPDTGNFDMQAIDAWCDGRHPHLLRDNGMGAVDARGVARDRIAQLRRQG
jgi:hypothetical protein